MWYFHSFPTSKLTKLRLVKSFSHVWLFAILWTVAHQAPPSMGFSRQEYWSGLTFPSPGYLPNPGIETRSPALQADLLFYICCASIHRDSVDTLFAHRWPSLPLFLARVSCSVIYSSLRPNGLWSARLLCPWDFSGKNTGVGSYSLLQGIFLTQGSTQVSCIAGRRFNLWATNIVY